MAKHNNANNNISRQDAIQNLIEKYKNRFGGTNSSGGSFFLHEGIEYFSDDIDGVGVRATKPIAANTVILTVPNSERVSLLNVPKDNKFLKRILQTLADKYDSLRDQFVKGLGCLGDIYPRGDITLSVVVMYELADENKSYYTRTWPTPKDFETFCYPIWFQEYQTTQFQQLLKGTSTLELLERYDRALKHTFEHVVKPVLLNSKQTEKFSSSMMIAQTEGRTIVVDNLWETFRYASSLVRSRSHESSRVEGECDIIPLVDLTNGMPAYCSNKINVQMTKGNDNDENKNKNKKKQITTTTSLKTTRDVEAGEELILSYGDVHASHFAVRYGCFPMEIVDNIEGSLDCITIRIPTSLAPTDAMRSQACAKARLPSTKAMLQKWFCGLHYSVLQQLRTTTTTSAAVMNFPPQLQSIRTFLIISHLLDDNGVLQATRNPGCLPSALKQSWSATQEGQLFLLLLDYNIQKVTTLNESTNQEDLTMAAATTNNNNSNDLVTAYRARICQRDTFAQWRHAFCQHYKFESEPVVSSKRYQVFCNLLKAKGDTALCRNQPLPQVPQCLLVPPAVAAATALEGVVGAAAAASGACPQCGRTINLKSCSRCKQVQYCCRDHQRMDWKNGGHKKVCVPAAAATAKQ